MTTRNLPAALLLTALIGPSLAQEPAPQEKLQEEKLQEEKLQEEKPQEKPAEPQAERPIRNAPNPRALELAAYLYAAVNVCGYRIGVPEFEAVLAKHNTKPADVGPRGPFANRLMTMFTMMSNQIQLDRERACLAVAGEYGPDGVIARNVLQPAGAAPSDGNPSDGKSPEGAPGKTAQ